ncbi:MAG: radical SAM protein [Bacillota bacterium]|nr:radical SAM protein [Bacillota bacterium]
MSEDLRMDSHKLIFHPGRVSDWLNGKNIYPLTIEVSPSGACNHRCIFCGLDYLGYKPRCLDKDLIIPNLEKMKEKGVKAIVIAGEGEPLLNKETSEIIKRSWGIGLDIGMSTNGVLFTREIADKCLSSINWIRFSVNGASEESYRIVHRSRKGDFAKVLQNIADAVEVKKAKNLKTTIGVQMVLIPQNSQGLLLFAEKLKEIGVDYFTIKPFSQHPQSHCSIDPDFNYEDYLELEQSLKAINSSSYQVIFRADSMRKLQNDKRNYTHCLGIPFWAYIDSNASVWPCLAYIGREEFCLGNLKEKDFVSIWESERCQKIISMISTMDISVCRELCRLDSINEYLYQLVNPGEHVNFI